MSAKADRFAQTAVLALLHKGGRHTTRQISERCRVSDPRGTIRCLIKHGWHINSEWQQSTDGTRYKQYWLENDSGTAVNE